MIASDAKAVALLDIEGTIADARFVHDVLFPYARAVLPEFIRRHAANPAVRAELDATADAAGLDAADSDAVVGQLVAWIDADVKATPLKSLQGMIWREGYRRGEFTAHLYDDAYRWMRRAHEAGVPLYIYSSGSIEAQQLYFAHTTHGDLGGWLAGHFDTRTGPKKVADSYRAIAERIDLQAGAIRFYSDVAEELDAAAEAGCRTVHLRRDGQPSTGRHAEATDFSELPLPGEDPR
jgi:enolase-phosphatase E1